MTDILKNFITQILKANTDLAPYILETFANHGQLPSRRVLERIFEQIVDSTTHLRIIVDGLDECSREDQEDILYNLGKVKGPSTGSHKLLICSRNIESMAALSHAFSVIRLEDNLEHVHLTIASYVRTRLESLGNRFTTSIIRRLENQILVKANGKGADALPAHHITHKSQECFFG